MRSLLLLAAVTSLSTARASSAAAPALPAIVPDRVIPLFNGKDLSGWEADVPARDTDKTVRDSFIVREGLLVSLGKPEGHLLTRDAYRDYRLQVEYRFPGAPGNCGVLVHASRPRALYKMFPQSIEVQMHSGNAGDFWVIQEDIKVPDMERRRPRKEGEKWGGSEGDARRILNLTDGSEKPLGQWNTMVIEARDRTVKVWVNGELVNDGFDATTDRGRIALQAEGTEVEFRRVDIGPLGPAASPRAGPELPDRSFRALGAGAERGATGRGQRRAGGPGTPPRPDGPRAAGDPPGSAGGMPRCWTRSDRACEGGGGAQSLRPVGPRRGRRVPLSGVSARGVRPTSRIRNA